MSFKAILFCLFLYVCLVWVGASYFYSGPEVEHVGLMGTGIGLAAVLVLIPLATLLGWARVWRAQRAARPKPPAASARPAHEEDAPFAALLKEATVTLSRMRSEAGESERVSLSDLPAYLLIGPDGSGKTSTFINSGLEPQLLAGQLLSAGPPAPTPLCNIWFAQGALFIEVAGAYFNGDPGRWREILSDFKTKPSASRWQELWSGADVGLDFRAAVAFCDSKEFSAALAPQTSERLERQGQLWQERLGALTEVLGFRCPVYVLLTKCDNIPYFSDYFRRLPEAETGQVLGCALSAQPNTSGESHATTLTRAFNGLFHSLAEWRITQLAREPDMSRRPAVYEFPRELKRLRAPVIQFLTVAFRPNPLRPSPRLCGYYFTAVGEKEVEPALALADSRYHWAEQVTSSLDTTSLFRADATQILRGGGDLGLTEKRTGPSTQRRWLFVSELFRTVLPVALSVRQVPRPALAAEKRLRLACAIVCGVCLLFCGLLINSWVGNLHLLRSLRSSAVPGKTAAIPTLDNLQALEDLRGQVGTLVTYDRSGPPLGLRWGLYSGERLLHPMKAAYFLKFQALLLDPLNGALTANLVNLPLPPSADASYTSVYRALKAHLMITSGVCRPDPALLTQVLNETLNRIMPGQEDAWRSLASRQIAFYTSELPNGNPCRLAENITARDRSRQYLLNIQGADRMYGSILASAEKTFPKPQRLADLAPAYTRVLSGPGDIPGVFTPEGLAFIEKLSQSKKTNNPEDECVLGGAASSLSGSPFYRNGDRAIRQLFLRDYAARWRTYLGSFSVLPYKGTADAAQKLEILSDHKSPLLALFAMASNETNFNDAAIEPAGVAPIVKKIFPSLAGKAPTTPQLPKRSGSKEPFGSPGEITRAFQPVHLVVPPASETWVVDKNHAYVDALAALGHSMLEISRCNAAPTAEQTPIYQAAAQNYDKAIEAARQLARNFEPVGVAGLDVTVERLLEAPVRQAQRFIVTDPEGLAAGQLNGKLHSLCERVRPTLRKYPFAPSGPDATLEEVAGLFAPGSGAVWKFQTQSLADLAMKENGYWKAKDPSKKPQITPDLLNFLNRAQALSDAFYPAGATQPQLTYILRPKLDPSFKDAVVEFQVDGTLHSWTSSLQKQFTWPAAPASKDIGVKGSIRMGSVSFPFTSRGGTWAIFRVMGDAEPRALSSRVVEWREIRGGDGRVEQIQPAPVRLEFVQFPGGVDLFNPRFFQDLQCPGKAVQ